MPEIPEIEGLVHFLGDRLAGSRFAHTQIGAISAVKTAEPPLTALDGTVVARVGRSGKFLWFESGGDPGPRLFLATHLSRAGWLRWYDSPPATRLRMGRGTIAARFTFVDDSGSVAGGFDLTEAGTQKRLAIYLVGDLAKVPGIARLGPDPLAGEFTPEVLDSILTAAGGRHLKTVLRDQATIAGIGNAYSDEILHTARLSPATRSDSLTAAQRRTLSDTIRTVLETAVADARSRPPSQLKDNKRSTLRVHGRTGEKCPVCGDVIREVRSGDSDYQYCPTCQNDGKVLADHRLSRLLK